MLPDLHAAPGAAEDREAGLAQLVEERTRELTTLLRISREVTSNRSLDSVLIEILDKLKSVADFSNATIVRKDGDSFYYIADYNARDSFTHRGNRFSAQNRIDQKVMQEQKPLVIGDIHSDETAEAEEFRRISGNALETYYREVHSWMRVPLVFRGEIVGMLTLHHNRPSRYSAHQADLAMAFAEYAAIAMENARLFETLEKRTSELASLLNVAHTITSTLDLGSLLTVVLTRLNDVVEYDLALIGIMDENDGMVLAAGRGAGLAEIGTRIPLHDRPVTREILASGQARFIPDINADNQLAKTLRRDMDAQKLSHLHSWMGVPLISRERGIGLLSLSHSRPGFYTGIRVDLVTTFAQQAAVAIENARLYEQARELAVIEERQRLARELHDSVSQALYGIALGARTARTLLGRDPARVSEPLDYISSLAEAGLAEMRALIMELQPETLKHEGLAVAVTKQADALRARHQVEVVANLCPEPEIPLAVKEALYRVAQEAMNNIVKHARAKRVELSLAAADGVVSLQVSDNGQGFDPGREFPGHFGLRSMRERVEKHGGQLEVTSAPGAGTTISVRIPVPERSED